ncbi:MAG: glycine cleavage system protein GcvH, partial [Deltaproteobacteria bacterium]|jgi:glycine cleavage system H protein|nr:glycine cleavage system protein GcvH [Deltaproteobacteria bacterium]
VIGITAFAQEQLGDITYVDLPAVGTRLEQGAAMGSIESVKAASDLYSPVSGAVIAVNDALADKPELINQDPFGQGWLLRAKISAKPADLMDAKDYALHAEASAH